MILNSADRREHLIRILILRGHATLSELSTELGVSQRTVMRDVDALSIRVPIYTVAGRYGGIYIDKHHLQNHTYLRANEISLLKKIVYSIEQHSFCSLNDEELKLLKNIIKIYSKEV